jgi:hypothetical protein
MFTNTFIHRCRHCKVRHCDNRLMLHMHVPCVWPFDSLAKAALPLACNLLDCECCRQVQGATLLLLLCLQVCCSRALV